VKFSSKYIPLVVVLALALPCAGCGGFQASRSVSPLDFILPGILKADPAQPDQQHNTVPPTQPNRQLALAK
jgi:hypothetical protein